MQPLSVPIASALLALLSVVSVSDPVDAPVSRDQNADSKQALAKFNSLIGGWRGIGQPKRNSNRGAWSEKARWEWDFRDNAVALRYIVDKGKLIRNARLTFNPDTQQYALSIAYTDETERRFFGTKDGRNLVLQSQPHDGSIHRATVTLLNKKRTLILLERRRENQSFYSRIAQIGYTREGTSLAVAGAGEPECVVTGGKGTIAVNYNGKTYYVCCSGCRQAFDDDPAGIIAEYNQRIANRKSK